MSIPIYTRLFDTNTIGNFTLFYTTAIFIATISSLRLDSAVVIARTRVSTILLCLLAIASSIIISFIITLFLFIFFQYYNYIYTLNDFFLFYILVITICFQKLFCGISIRYGYFTIYSFTNLFISVLPICISIILLKCNVPYTQLKILCFSLLITFFLSVFIYIIYYFYKFKLKFLKFIKFRYLYFTLLRYRSYLFYMTPYTLISNIRERLIIYTLSIYSSPSQVAFYSIANRVVNAPNNFIASTLRPIFFNYLSCSNNKSDKFIFNSFNLMFISSFPFILFYFKNQRELTTIILGENFVSASYYINILIIPVYILTIGNWMDKVFEVFNKQKDYFYLESIFSILSIILIPLLCYFTFDLNFIIKFQSLFLTIYYLVWLIYALILCEYKLILLGFNFLVLSISVVFSFLYFYFSNHNILIDLVCFSLISIIIFIFYTYFIQKCFRRE